MNFISFHKKQWVTDYDTVAVTEVEEWTKVRCPI